MHTITTPTMIIDTNRMLHNINTMVSKSEQSGTIFRPHFKTHQSADIGKTFEKKGVDSITVSSVDMALYFADNGWQNILIAFPVNPLEVNKIKLLAEKVALHLLVDSKEILTQLVEKIKKPVSIYIKVDTGYHRSGILWNNTGLALALVKMISSSHHSFTGLLTHNGHSYHVKTDEDRINIYNDSTIKINSLADHLRTNGYSDFIISTGDTPGLSTIDKFEGVDEVRPGNFVFYDVMQANAGVCSYNDIAVAVACPVVGKYEDRKQAVLYGGAIHFSKESVKDYSGNTVFGYRVEYDKDGLKQVNLDNPLVSLSQEHGILQLDDTSFENVNIGDVVMILPVHSCLTATQFKEYVTFEDNRISKMQDKGYF